MRYDERGCGLSDRNAKDLSLDAFVTDLETVVDAAAIPGAEFLSLDGRNHILLEAEPAFDEFKTGIRDFLRRHSA